MSELPLVSVVVETSNWHREHEVQLWDTLGALGAQTYPSDRMEVLVVLDAPHHSAEAEIARSYPWIRILSAPAGLTYYELKNFGARRASGEILALTDADCLPASAWVEELVRSFAETDPKVAAVQGSTRFLNRPLARAWEASWWSRSFEKEGLIDRLYTSNNVAFRGEIYRDHHYLEGTPLRAGLERPLTRELQRAGYLVWLNPRMLVQHNYSPTVREIAQLGLVRGFNFMILRRSFPGRFDFIIKRLGLLAPLLCSPILLAKDIARLVGKARKMGIRLFEIYKIPLFILLQLPYQLLVLAGMYWAILRQDHQPRRPL